MSLLTGLTIEVDEVRGVSSPIDSHSYGHASVVVATGIVVV